MGVNLSPESKKNLMEELKDEFLTELRNQGYTIEEPPRQERFSREDGTAYYKIRDRKTLLDVALLHKDFFNERHILTVYNSLVAEHGRLMP